MRDCKPIKFLRVVNANVWEGLVGGLGSILDDIFGVGGLELILYISVGLVSGEVLGEAMVVVGGIGNSCLFKL